MTRTNLPPRRQFLKILSMLGLLAATGNVFAKRSSGLHVGCQANGFPLSPEDFSGLLNALRSMKGLGYAGFECNVRFVQDQFRRAEQARLEIEQTGVEFLGAHTNVEQAASGDFAELVKGVRAMGAKFMVMSAKGLAADGRFGRPELLRKAAELTELGKVCRDAGLLLAYHNHNPEFANHGAEIEALAQETDPELVHFLIDAGHAYLGGGDPVAFLRVHGQRVRGFHVKTFKGSEQVPLGQGDFDFGELAAAIRKTHWAGWLITEEGGSRLGNTAALGPDRQYIRRVFRA
jgi:sugar phosphate isomerase/epimerase